LLKLSSKQSIRNFKRNPEPKFIILYNFSHLKIRSHVFDRINKSQKKIFKFEEQLLFNNLKTLKKEGDIHKNFFKGGFEIIHLLLLLLRAQKQETSITKRLSNSFFPKLARKRIKKYSSFAITLLNSAISS